MLDQLGLGGGDGLRGLAGLLGTSEDSAKDAAGAALPALLGGLSQRTSSPEGAGALFNLAKSTDGSVLDNVPGFLGRGDAGPLGSLIGGIFGKKQDGAAAGIAEASGVDVAAIGRMLPMLAPLIMGFLGKKVAGGADQAGMMSTLGEQTTAAKEGPFGKLMGLFDGPSDPEDDEGFVSTVRGLLPVGAADDDSDDDVPGAAGSGAGSKAAGAAAAGATALGGAAAAAKASATDKAGAAGEMVSDKTAGAARQVRASTPDTPDIPDRPKAAAPRPRTVEPERKERGFPWWILAVLAGIIALALILTQCLGDDDDDGGDTSTDTAEDTADADADSTADADADEATDDAAGVVELGAVQASVDGALDTDGSATATVDENGVVTLTGTATSEEAKTAAGDAALEVDGVTDVVNDIIVEEGDGDSPEDADEGDPVEPPVETADLAAVQAAVDGALGDDGTATATIDENGIVSLSGTAVSEEAKTAAGDAALEVDGVSSVDNQIVVEEAAPVGDAAAIQAAADGAVGEPGVVTATIDDDGLVTLTGTVATEELKNAAGAAVIPLDGVLNVDNQIVVEEAAAPLDFENIFFDVNSTDIKAESQATLDEVAEFLNANADVSLSIEGHTDSDGDDASNQTLSEGRAKSVLDALVGRGIAADRLTSKGFGESQPLGGDKANDRRIEFVPVG